MSTGVMGRVRGPACMCQADDSLPATGAASGSDSGSPFSSQAVGGERSMLPPCPSCPSLLTFSAHGSAPAACLHLPPPASTCIHLPAPLHVHAVEFKGERKQFAAEEISSMVLSKMRETAEVSPRGWQQLQRLPPPPAAYSLLPHLPCTCLPIRANLRYHSSAFSSSSAVHSSHFKPHPFFSFSFFLRADLPGQEVEQGSHHRARILQRLPAPGHKGGWVAACLPAPLDPCVLLSAAACGLELTAASCLPAAAFR